MSLARDLVYTLVGAVTAPVWGWSLYRTGKWRTDWAGRFGRVELRPELKAQQKHTLLLHAVSVGEVNAIRHLVQMLDDMSKGTLRIVISVTTDTGIARAQQVFEKFDVVRYPLDFTPCVNGFLDAIQPDAVALVELEVWPNFVECCAARRVPVCVVNGRLSERSIKGYRWLKPVLRSTFASLAHAAVQTAAYHDRFAEMGVPADRLTITDSMKWDTAQIEEAGEVKGQDELVAALGIDRSRPLIVAGSTGPGEEQLLLQTCPAEAQLLIAPRKPERFDEAAAALPGCVRRTLHKDGTTRKVDAGTRLFLLDTIGELRRAYALADVVLVGRSFLGSQHGSDPIEPVALGKPVVIGPYHSDFTDIVRALELGGGLEVSDKPGEVAAALLKDDVRARRLARAGREVILARQGATRKTAELLLRHLPRRN